MGGGGVGGPSITTATDTDKHYAATHKDGLTGFHVGFKMLDTSALRTLYTVILSIFLTVFYITPYLDSVLYIFIILQCFKSDQIGRKYSYNRTNRYPHPVSPCTVNKEQ
jgi:hypothetical protein